MTKSNNMIDYSSLSPRLLAPILLTLIFGIALSIGAFFFGRNLEHDRTKAAVGFDLASNPTRFEALNRSRDQSNVQHRILNERQKQKQESH